MRLYLPQALRHQLWQHARRVYPHECVGAIGGHWQNERGQAEAKAHSLYPLENIAAHPTTEYLAHPGQLVRALKAMHASSLELVALYHSHPHGPAWPSPSDQQQAAYPVPYLIADLSQQLLRGFLLIGSKSGAAVTEISLLDASQPPRHSDT